MKKNVKETIRKFENKTGVRVFVTHEEGKYHVIAHNTLSVICKEKTQNEVKRVLAEKYEL